MKDEKTKVIKELIDRNWPSQKAFAEKIEVPYTTLRSMLERGVGNASVNNVIKVCKGLGITTEDLEKMANGDDINAIAAHHSEGDWTEEELEEIEEFKKYIRSKRNN